MPTIERTVVFGSRDANGNETIYYPVTKLKNIDGNAEVKDTPKSADYVPVIDMEDGGKMKKTSLLSVVGDSTVFTPSVSESGVLSWTNDGGLANPSPVNISGPYPDIHVGEIETLIAGSNATVNRKSDSSNADPVLEFGIPRGADAVSSSTPAISFYLQNDHLMMRYEGDEDTPVPTPIVKPDGHLYLTYTLDINVFKIYFDDEFIGQTFTVTDGADETKTGIVPKSGITEVNICGCNTTYTISAQTGGVTYSSTVTTGPDYRQYIIGFVTDISIISKVPSQNGSLTYSGDEQTPSWNNYDTDMMTIDGVTSAINAGSYKAIFRPKNGYIWKNGTKSKIMIPWSIGRATCSIPYTNDVSTYNGSAQSPTWINYDSNKMTIGGATSGTNAGSYTTTFTPASNYQWSDGTTGTKSIAWSISKAAGSLSIDKTSMSLNASNLTGTITVTRAGNGAITASSSNTNVATVSVSGTTVTVTAKDDGNATITISVAAGTNHNAPASKSCSVIAGITSPTLANNTPAIIQKAARAGKAANYWSVGDKIGIALNGTVGSLSLNDTYYAFIIGFNHNSTYEGSNSIHFQFGKTSDGVDIAFVDSHYNNISNDAIFRMNTSSSNKGGLSSSYMRNTICSAFFSAMPSEWRNITEYCIKYSDNTAGDITDTASRVTSTSDKIWLLSEFEVFGTRTYANSAEKNYQTQYTYYYNTSSKVHYRHSTGSKCAWWLRSPGMTSSDYFCRVTDSGNATAGAANYSLGFAPGFKVA